MIEPPILREEPQRLARLARLQVMDTAADPVLDRLTALATTATGMPISLVSLVDEYRQWWKSAVGLPQGGQTGRNISFCGHAIASSALFEVEDARLDPRFCDNPIVTGPPHVIHYAGMPLQMPTGERIGTICVIDHRPGRITPPQHQMLRLLGGLVVDILLQREKDRAEAAAQQAEASRRAAEHKLSAAANAMPQVLWIADAQGKVDFFNDRWYELTGVARGRTNGLKWRDLIHPDDRARVRQRWRHSVDTGQPYEAELRLRHANGQYRWLLSQARALRDEHGEVEEWIGTCTNVHGQHLAQDQLREADRQKDEFLAMLSHELRNPLAPITSGAYALQQCTDPLSRRVGAIIAKQSRHMKQLVDDLMDVARVTRGLAELHREAVDLRTIVQDALEQVRPLIESQRHQVVVRAGALPAPTQGDPVRLVQVVANLLTNSAKYTPPGGRIEVAVEMETDTVRVQVRDNGQGIDAQLLPYVFDLFTQEHRSSDRSTGGLGLGLSLVRSLVALHGGTVAAHSEGKGLGATFTVSLPRAGSMPVLDRATAGAPTAAGHSLSVMVVDDNGDVAHGLADWLQAQGHQVRVESDPLHALGTLEEACPEVFILDLGLPFMDGYALAQRLRRDPQGRRATLIALSGYQQAADVRRAREVGFDHHLGKPADLGALAAALRAGHTA